MDPEALGRPEGLEEGCEEEALKEEEPTRICRICFEGEGEGEALIAPCQCDGSVPSGLKVQRDAN